MYVLYVCMYECVAKFYKDVSRNLTPISNQQKLFIFLGLGYLCQASKLLERKINLTSYERQTAFVASWSLLLVLLLLLCVCARSMWHFAVLPNKGEKGVFKLSLLSFIFIFLWFDWCILKLISFVDRRFYKIELNIHKLGPYRARETVFTPKCIGS